MAAFPPTPPRARYADVTTGTRAPQPTTEEFLVAENAALREAGCDLAVAAMKVVRDYDGTHRLALAVAAWAQAVADEGGRTRATLEVKHE